MNNQPTNQPINEMIAPEGFVYKLKLVRIKRTDAQIKAQNKYEEKNRAIRNEKRKINNNLRYANDPDYREYHKEYYNKKNNPQEYIKL